MANLPAFQLVWNEKKNSDRNSKSNLMCGLYGQFQNQSSHKNMPLEDPQSDPIGRKFNSCGPGGYFGPRDGSRGDVFVDATIDSCTEGFSCCNRTFYSEDHLNSHRAEHIQCSVVDCPFSAHPKLVEFHFNNQHRNGLFSKIWKSESKEDIEQWRQDRKKNFPSKFRVEQKKAVEDAKRERGELLETKYFGRISRGRGRGRSNSHVDGINNTLDNDGCRGYRGRGRRGRGFQRGSQNNRGRWDRGGNRFKNSKMNGVAYQRPSEDPLSGVLSGRELDFLNSEQTILNDPNSGVTEEVVNDSTGMDDRSSVALGLLGSYESDSESDGCASNTPQQKNEEVDVTPVSIPWQPSRRGELFPPNPVVNLAKIRRRCLGDPKRLLKRPKLLEMLLSLDIRHERNVLLQCVRYVCTQNYFGVGQTKGSAPAKVTISKPVSPKVNPTIMNSCYEDEIWEDS